MFLTNFCRFSFWQEALMIFPVPQPSSNLESLHWVRSCFLPGSPSHCLGPFPSGREFVRFPPSTCPSCKEFSTASYSESGSRIVFRLLENLFIYVVLGFLLFASAYSLGWLSICWKLRIILNVWSYCLPLSSAEMTGMRIVVGLLFDIKIVYIYGMQHILKYV